MTLNYPARVARETILKYKSKNPFSIAEHMGIRTIERDLGDPDVDGTALGVYINLGNKNSPRFIFINENLSEREKYVSCAHELGHAILHNELNTAHMMTSACYESNVGVLEAQANTFAAELLLPSRLPCECDNFSYDQIASFFRVPLNYVMLKTWQ